MIHAFRRRILLSMPVDVGSRLCNSSQRIACFRQMCEGQLRDLIEMLHERLRLGTFKDAFRNAHSVFGEAPRPYRTSRISLVRTSERSILERIARARTLVAAGKPVLGNLATTNFQWRGITWLGPANSLSLAGIFAAQRGRS